MKPLYKVTDQEIQEIIDEGLDIRESERDQFGEVFTPRTLIDEILDALPQAIWKSPYTRWLDPAAGTGHFPLLVYTRLMRGLASAIPNVADRSNHIVTKMLYMVELNPESVKILHQLFGKGANIVEADFLTYSYNVTFDIVLGNPPFQTPKTEGTRPGGAGKGQTLWDKFVVKGLAVLEKGGYLAMITPASWRRPEAALYTLMTRENRLRFLHIYSKADGIRMFGVETRFDTFVVQKTDQDGTQFKTVIIDEKGHIDEYSDLGRWPFLPNWAYKLIRPLLSQVPRDDVFDVVFSASIYDARKLSKKKTSAFRWPVVHSITQEGPQIRYAKDRDSTQFGVAKVLLSFNERQYPVLDMDGRYGMSQMTFGIQVRTKKEGESLIRAIQSPTFQDVIRATKWGAFQTDYRMFRHFSKEAVLRLGKTFGKHTIRHDTNTKKTRKRRSIHRR